METTISVTSKWQIHIPKAMRHVFGKKKPGQVKIKTGKGKLVISPKKGSILDLGGSLHHLYKKKPIDIDNIRDYIDYSKA